jgi:hypothetical protein
MGRVAADMSMSLDGFIAGPNDGIRNPLGDGGERLHEWMSGQFDWGERHGLTGGQSTSNAEIYTSFANAGAVVMG